MSPVSNPWDEEFAPSTGARNTLRWAHEMGASTLGEAYDMLEQLDLSNDVPGGNRGETSHPTLALGVDQVAAEPLDLPSRVMLLHERVHQLRSQHTSPARLLYS
jgi:hypothetical protein